MAFKRPGVRISLPPPYLKGTFRKKSPFFIPAYAAYQHKDAIFFTRRQPRENATGVPIRIQSYLNSLLTGGQDSPKAKGVADAIRVAVVTKANPAEAGVRTPTAATQHAVGAHI
jgi:hypothetical protein